MYPELVSKEMYLLILFFNLLCSITVDTLKNSISVRDSTLKFIAKDFVQNSNNFKSNLISRNSSFNEFTLKGFGGNQSFYIDKGLDFSTKDRFKEHNNFTTHSGTIKIKKTSEHEIINGVGRSDHRQSWYLQVLRSLHLALRGCQGSMNCYQRRVLQGLDRALEADSVEICDGVFLVKERQEEDSMMSRGSDSESFLLAVTRRVICLLESHALRVRLGFMKETVGQARIGHHGYKQAFPLMVGSFMVMAAFLVPMGFQFLAVLGGKALILSQVALVMAMGGSLQRFLGLGVGKYGVDHHGVGHLDGVGHHDYYHRDDHPWQRKSAEGIQKGGTQDSNHQPHPQYLTNQQLHGFINHKH